MKIILKIVEYLWDKPIVWVKSKFKFLESSNASTISEKDYSKLFDDDREMAANALAKAWEIRNFEINLYWQRATYFWAFIAVTFGGYFAIIGSDKIIARNYQIEYLIICIGIVFTISWLMVNIASKKWQENWEGHIDKLEDNITGPIYKTVRNYSINYSVSKINIYVSAFILVIWLLLATNFYFNNITFSCNNSGVAWLVILSTIVTVFFILVLIVKARTGLNKNESNYFNRQPH